MMLIRLIPVLADLGVALLLWAFGRRVRGEWVGLLAGGVYFLSPGTIWDSAYTTHIDPLASLQILAVALLAYRRRWAWSLTLASWMVFTKPQLAPAVPVVALAAWRQAGWRPVLFGFLGGVGVAGALFLPFVLAGRIPQVVRMFQSMVGVNPTISAGAFNFWYLVRLGDTFVPDTLELLPGLSYRVAGLALFAAAQITALLMVFRKPTPERVLAAIVVTQFAYALLTTESTERYLYPTLALLIAWAIVNTRVRWIAATALCTFFVNLYLLYPLVRITPWDALKLESSNYRHGSSARDLQARGTWSIDNSAMRAVGVVLGGVHCVLFLGTLALATGIRRGSAVDPDERTGSFGDPAGS